MTGLASPEEGVNVPQDPMSPGEAAMKLVQRRVPQEATPENAAAIGMSTMPVKPALIAAALLGGGALLSGDSEAGAPRLTKAQRRQMEMDRIRGEQETAEKLRLMEAETQQAKQRGANDAELAALAEKQAEYQRQVKMAEAARDNELSRDRRFSDTGVGKVFQAMGGLAPVAAGLLGGGLSRLATGPGKGLTGQVVKDYALPALTGTAAGFTAANAPLAYDAFYTDPDNPQKAAYQAYSRELPQGHPRKQEFGEFAKGLPDKNPVREQAGKEFYDDFGKRLGMSAIEGGGGALLGSDSVRSVAKALLGRGRSAAPAMEAGPMAAPRALAPPHEGPRLHHSNYQPRKNGEFKKGRPRLPAND
jgi:hypothetical protein